MALRHERFLASLLYGSRWILAPCYVGLMAGLAIVLVEFFHELIETISHLWTLPGNSVILAMLKLVDLLLVGNLLLIMAFAGVETMLSRSVAADSSDRPEWMGKVDFSGLKLKVLASIIAISAVQLLETFMNVAAVDKITVLWQIAILLTFVISGVLLALMDRLAGQTH